MPGKAYMRVEISHPPIYTRPVIELFTPGDLIFLMFMSTLLLALAIPKIGQPGRGPRAYASMRNMASITGLYRAVPFAS